MTDIKTIHSIFTQSNGLTTDSRQVRPGMVYLAIKGDRFDGNTFVEQALKDGAIAAIIDDETIAAQLQNKRILLCENTLTTLQELAHYHRMTLDIPVIGITGTNGKTTTKELIAAVLQKKYNVLYTQGNLNNHIGVPLTLLQITKKHHIAVIEMGANHPLEIDTLSRIAVPTHGLITNVGKAHLEGFGNFEGVIQTKTELYRFLAESVQASAQSVAHKPLGAIFYDEENEFLKPYLPKIDSQYLKPYVTGQILKADPALKISWKEGQCIQTKLVGTYNLKNMLAAVTIGQYFNVPDQDINDALSHYTPTNNRSQYTITETNRLIVDAYNANPTSMHAAIDNFATITMANKVLILGDMKELGQDSLKEHQRIVDLLKTLNFEEVFLIGHEFQQTESDFTTFANRSDFEMYLTAHPLIDKTILIKGSNGMQLYRLPQIL